MSPLIIILTLLLVGLAYIGAVQVYRYIRKQYQEWVTLWVELKDLLRSRRKESRTITIKVHNRPPTPPPAPPKQQEAIEEIVVKSKSEETHEDAEYVPQEPLFISVEVDGEQYTMCENITADELEQMSRTLSVKSAPMEEEITTARTLCKLNNSPLLDALGSSKLKERLNGLLANAIINDPKIVKEGFDYSGFITK